MQKRKIIMKKDVVAGLGEIGSPIQKLLSRTIPVVGYDKKTKLINTKKFKKFENYETEILHICIPFTKNFISMEFIDGFILNDYIQKFQNNSVFDLRLIIADLLYQCFILDINGIDHGELSNLKKHVIISDKAYIIDFDSASQTRRVSNLTSSAQYLFIGGPFSSYFQKIFSIDVDLLKTKLKNYKFNQNHDNFNNIFEILDLHL